RPGVWPAAGAAHQGNDDPQALLGDRSGLFPGEQEVEHSHASPPKILLKNPYLPGWPKRLGRASPSRRATRSSYACAASVSLSRITGSPLLEALSTSVDSGITPMVLMPRISSTSPTLSISPVSTRRGL